MIKRNVKFIVLIFAIFTFIAISSEGDLSFIPVLISVMLMMSTFSYDEFNQSDAYIASFPNGRKNSVKAKYITTLLILFFSTLLTLIVSVTVDMIHQTLALQELFIVTFGCCASIILLQSLLYPLIFRYGIEKSRIAVFALAFGGTGIGALLVNFHLSFSLPETWIALWNQWWMGIIFIAALLLLWISYKVSEHIYLKKEF